MSPISRTEGQCRPGRIILPTLSHEEKRRDKAIVTENISSQVNETAVTAEEESVDVEQACVGMETSSTSLAVESSQSGALHTTW